MEENTANSIEDEHQEQQSKILGANLQFVFSGDRGRRLLGADDYEASCGLDDDYDEGIEYYATLAKPQKAEEFKALPGGSRLRENIRRKDKERQKRSPVARLGKYDTEQDSLFDEHTKAILLELIHQDKLCSVDALLLSGQAANLYRATGRITPRGATK